LKIEECKLLTCKKIQESAFKNGELLLYEVSLGETRPASSTKKVRIQIEDTRYLFKCLW